jgi:hypothetical protein
VWLAGRLGIAEAREPFGLRFTDRHQLFANGPHVFDQTPALPPDRLGALRQLPNSILGRLQQVVGLPPGTSAKLVRLALGIRPQLLGLARRGLPQLIDLAGRSLTKLGRVPLRHLA